MLRPGLHIALALCGAAAAASTFEFQVANAASPYGFPFVASNTIPGGYDPYDGFYTHGMYTNYYLVPERAFFRLNLTDTAQAVQPQDTVTTVEGRFDPVVLRWFNTSHVMAVGVIAYTGTTVESAVYNGYTGGISISKDGGRTFGKPVEVYTFNIHTDDSFAYVMGEWMTTSSIVVCGQSTCAYSGDGGSSFTAFSPLHSLGITKDTQPQPFYVHRTPDAQGRARLLTLASGYLDGGFILKSAVIEYSVDTATGAVVQTWRTTAPCGATSTVNNARYIASTPLGTMILYVCSDDASAFRTMISTGNTAGTAANAFTAINHVDRPDQPVCPSETVCFLTYQTSPVTLYKVTSPTDVTLMQTFPSSDSISINNLYNRELACISDTDCVLSGVNWKSAGILGSKLFSTKDGWVTYTIIDLNEQLNARKRLFMPYVNMLDSGYGTPAKGYVVGSARFNIVNVSADRTSIAWLRESSAPPMYPIVKSQMWDGNGLAITADGRLLTTYTGGASWDTPTRMPLGSNPDLTVSTVLFLSNTTWLMGVHSLVNASALPTSPTVMMTQDGGQTFTTVCSFPSPNASAPLRQITAWQPSGTARVPAIFFVHQFQLYQWNYETDSCGTQLMELTPAIMDESSDVYGQELLAVGCNPNPVRGCLLLAVQVQYAAGTFQSDAFGWGASSSYVHELIMYAGCATGGFTSNVSLPSDLAVAPGNDLFGTSDIMFLSEDYVFMYSASFVNTYAVSTVGGAVWTKPVIDNLDVTNMWVLTASVWNSTMLYFGITAYDQGDSSFLVRVTYTPTGVSLSNVMILPTTSFSNLLFSLKPTTITFQSPFRPEYSYGGAWEISTCEGASPSPSPSPPTAANPSNTVSATGSASATATPAGPSNTVSASGSASATEIPSLSITPSMSSTPLATLVGSVSSTSSFTASSSEVVSAAASSSTSPTFSPTLSESPSQSATFSQSASGMVTYSASASLALGSGTASASETESAPLTPTASSSISSTALSVPTSSGSVSASVARASTATESASQSVSRTASASASNNPASSATPSGSPTSTASASASPSPSPSSSSSSTATETATSSASSTPSSTASPTSSPAESIVPTRVPTAAATISSTASPAPAMLAASSSSNGPSSMYYLLFLLIVPVAACCGLCWCMCCRRKLHVITSEEDADEEEEAAEEEPSAQEDEVVVEVAEEQPKDTNAPAESAPALPGTSDNAAAEPSKVFIAGDGSEEVKQAMQVPAMTTIDNVQQTQNIPLDDTATAV